MNRLNLLKSFVQSLKKKYRLLIAGNFKTFFDEYQIHLYKKYQKVKLKKTNRVFETTIKGVSETGQLITQHSIEERFEFGEVEWII